MPYVDQSTPKVVEEIIQLDPNVSSTIMYDNENLQSQNRLLFLVQQISPQNFCFLVAAAAAAAVLAY